METRAPVAAAIAALLLAVGCDAPETTPTGGDPALKTLVKDFTVNEVLALSPFASAAGAEVGYDAAVGAQRLTWTEGRARQLTGVIASGAWDLSSSDLFALEVGLDRAEAQSTIELVFHFDEVPVEDGNAATAVVLPASEKLPRATYTVPRSSFTVTGTADWANVRHVEVRLRRAAFPGVNRAWIHGLWADVSARPTVLITFDDATSTAYTTAFPIMSAAGMRGTVYAAGSLLDSDPWFMTLPQLKAMYAAGWDVASHTWSHQPLSKQIWGYWRSGPTATIAFSLPEGASHGYEVGDTVTISGCDAAEYDGAKTVATVPDATTITFASAGTEPDPTARGYCRVVGGVPAATVRDELRENRDWLKANGFLRAMDHLAYPYGAWDPEAIAIWRDELGGRTARVVGASNAGRFVLPLRLGGDSRYLLSSWDLNDLATAAEALAQVDAAIAANASVIFAGHGVVASDPYGTQMRTSEFQAFIDGLAARRDAGEVDVVTISEWSRQP